MRRILVANRGEIACRVIRSCRKMDITTIAIFSEADEHSLHVELADEAICIGPPEAHKSYLVIDRIIEAAQSTNVDAIHPGYGFLAESATFAEAVIAAGLIWIGPKSATIADMGDKQCARSLAQAAGVPVLPGSSRFSPNETNGLMDEAIRIGFPLLVKSTAGGGGIGMKLVIQPDQLQAAVESTQKLAGRAFGDGTIFLERFINSARHIEVQIFGFGDGRVVHLFERDCSVQRRFQKIIEESPAPNLSEEVREQMFQAAIALASQEKYLGAGTVEYVLDADTEEFFFLEMNTRIQVEHPVSEMVTGLDIVELQLRLAGGDDLAELTQDSIVAKGHALEVRLYAENPDKKFYPSPGILDVLKFPESSPDLRIDTGFRAGDEVTVYYDPLVAKLITHGPDRNSALRQMTKALSDVIIEGIHSNTTFLKQIIQQPAFQNGEVNTTFIERALSR